jgi:hypothetical protein
MPAMNEALVTPQPVMAGLVPATHVFADSASDLSGLHQGAQGIGGGLGKPLEQQGGGDAR